MIVSKANLLGALISWRLFPLIAVLLVGGCKKAETPADPFTIQEESGFAEIASSVHFRRSGIANQRQRGWFRIAMACIPKRSLNWKALAYPNLTEPQKKAVQEVMVGQATGQQRRSSSSQVTRLKAS
jgi:hypothetical protein